MKLRLPTYIELPKVKKFHLLLTLDNKNTFKTTVIPDGREIIIAKESINNTEYESILAAISYAAREMK